MNRTIVCKRNVIWANNAAAENAGLMTTSAVGFNDKSLYGNTELHVMPPLPPEVPRYGKKICRLASIPF